MARTVAVIGSANADLFTRIDRRPEPGETVMGSDLVVMAGGKGANQAVAAGRLGADVSFIGCVGDDGQGRMLRAALTEAGVATRGLRVAASASGSAIIMVTPDGENSIVVSPGANLNVTPELVQDCSDIWLGADLVVMQMEIPMETVEYVADASRRSGARFVLNAAPAQPLPASVLAVCDPLVVNEGEAVLLLGSSDESGDPLRLSAALLGLGPRSVIITLGSRGAVYRERAAAQCGHVPARQIDAVDTTGAGDAFVGALCAALAEGAPLGACVEIATDVAAFAVEGRGAQASYPTPDALRARGFRRKKAV
ncbi:ribokinase [Georgenia wangjunii]|uniref:ribokinase n=1 Tax=Georgenia wangjunii TaxID=3117730 RepID=UPI002F26B214